MITEIGILCAVGVAYLGLLLFIAHATENRRLPEQVLCWQPNRRREGGRLALPGQGIQTGVIEMNAVKTPGIAPIVAGVVVGLGLRRVHIYEGNPYRERRAARVVGYRERVGQHADLGRRDRARWRVAGWGRQEPLSVHSLGSRPYVLPVKSAPEPVPPRGIILCTFERNG